MHLVPDEYLERFSDYDFHDAYLKGYRLILFDLDNTLVPHGAMPDEETASMLTGLMDMGFELAAVSNNELERVRDFCEPLHIRYVFHAEKPRKAGYIKAMELFGRTESETVFFGDQIFTDIWGAKRAGIHSVLVEPVDLSTDEPQIRLKRIAERIILKIFGRTG